MQCCPSSLQQLARTHGTYARPAPPPPACRSFVEPLAAGSGIPEVKTYLNGVHIRGLLTIRTLITKLSGITFSIAAGLIAGG